MLAIKIRIRDRKILNFFIKIRNNHLLQIDGPLLLLDMLLLNLNQVTLRS